MNSNPPIALFSGGKASADSDRASRLSSMASLAVVFETRGKRLRKLGFDAGITSRGTATAVADVTKSTALLATGRGERLRARTFRRPVLTRAKGARRESCAIFGIVDRDSRLETQIVDRGVRWYGERSVARRRYEASTEDWHADRDATLWALLPRTHILV